MAKVIGTKYEMEYQLLKKMFFIKVWGFYSPDDANAFINDYTAETKKFNPANTSLVIDCDGLVTTTSDAKVLLVNCMQLYMQLPYKNRIFIKSTSATCNIMLKSAMKEGGMVYGQDGLILDDLKTVYEFIQK